MLHPTRPDVLCVCTMGVDDAVRLYRSKSLFFRIFCEPRGLDTCSHPRVRRQPVRASLRAGRRPGGGTEDPGASVVAEDPDAVGGGEGRW